MRKTIYKNLILSSSLFFVFSCGETPTPKDNPALESLSLSGTYITEFSVGDVFTYDGLIVTANYSDESHAVVTPTDVSSPDMTVPGEQDITVTYLDKSASYQIIIKENETFDGYMYLAFYQKDIIFNDSSSYYLNPGVKDKDGQDVDVSDFPFRFEYDSSLITVSNYGGIKSKKVAVGSVTITCIYTVNENIKAKCVVNIVNSVKEKGWVLVSDYNSLSDKDILVMASPEYGVTASLDTLHSKLNPVASSFSSDKKTITSLGEGSIEFYLGIEEKGMTLEAQTGEYLVCTHQGKVKLDSSNNTNKYWDIHANYNIEDGAVIENDVESLGYMMYNVSQNYFSTYVDNSISQYMKLPFLYRLEELN